MKIFILTSDLPCRAHGREHVTALHIVTREIIVELARTHQIILQIILPLSRKTKVFSDAEKKEVDDLLRCGVTVLSPIFPDAYRPLKGPKSFRTLSLLLRPSECLKHFYPASQLHTLMRSRIEKAKADIVFPLWSVDGTAATEGCEIPRMVYQGDIDFEPRLCQFLDRDFFGADSNAGSSLRRWCAILDRRVRLWLFERTHLRLMRGVESIAHVSACNVEYYTRHGHPRSFYIGNTWSDPGKEKLFPAVQRSHASGQRTVRIIGHVGYLNRTGGAYGLRCLLQDVLPHLSSMLRDYPHEIHILGGGRLLPSLIALTSFPHVLMRGFVEDLDSELAMNDVFLLLNNAGRYKAAYTRHLLAWSMGLCLVVHSGSRKAMPEIVHGENALVGSSGEEIAKLIVRAATDPVLNRRIREGGRRTYEQCFTPPRIAKRFSDECERMIKSSR